MKFGVRYCNTARYTKPENAVELVQAAEAAGFESAWTVDHVVVPEGSPARDFSFRVTSQDEQGETAAVETRFSAPGDS